MFDSEIIIIHYCIITRLAQNILLIIFTIVNI